MSTPVTVKAQLLLLLSNANNTTKENDITLTEAQESLIEGYGSGGNSGPDSGGDSFGGNDSVVLEEKLITENGTYYPSSGCAGFSKVTVNVKAENGGSKLQGTLSLYNYGKEKELYNGYVLKNSDYIYGVYTIL